MIDAETERAELLSELAALRAVVKRQRAAIREALPFIGPKRTARKILEMALLIHVPETIEPGKKLEPFRFGVMRFSYSFRGMELEPIEHQTTGEGHAPGCDPKRTGWSREDCPICTSAGP